MRVRVEGTPDELAEKAVDLLDVVARKVAFHPLAKTVMAEAAAQRQPTGLDRERTTVGRDLLKLAIDEYDMVYEAMSREIAAALVREGLVKAVEPDDEFEPPLPDAKRLSSEIGGIIREYHEGLAASLTGTGSEAESERSPVEMSYLFGLLLGNAKDRAAVEQMDPSAFIGSALDIGLPENEQRKAEALALDASERVKHFGSEIATAVTSVITGAVIAGTVVGLGVKIMQALRRGKARWSRVAATVLHAARDRGSISRHGAAAAGSETSAYVYRRAQPDACPYCAALHTGPDGHPRIFKLEVLEANGTNVGRTKAEWQAVIGPIHPFCRCETHPVPEGHGFNEHGELVAGGEYGVRYESEEEIARSLQTEAVDLEKSCGHVASRLAAEKASDPGRKKFSDLQKKSSAAEPMLTLGKAVLGGGGPGSTDVYGLPGHAKVQTPVSPSGAAGPNLQGGVPITVAELTDVQTSKERLQTGRTERELAYDRASMKPRKEGIYETFEMQSRDREVQPASTLADKQLADPDAAREDAEENKQAFADEAARRAAGDAAPNRPVRLILHAGGQNDEVKESLDAPRPVADEPLAVGEQASVNKRKFGKCFLERTKGGFTVYLPGHISTAQHKFDTLSAACDYVWCKAKGYEDAADYKAQTGKNKVPSGAGWRFWGLKPKPAAEAA